MTIPAFVGVDLGTTAAKAIAVGFDGQVLGASSVSYPTHRPRSWLAEQNPSDWLEAIELALFSVRSQADFSPVSVGICAQVNTHVFVDDELTPIRPAITWQDQRCASIAQRLSRDLGHDRIKRLWGGAFSIDASFSMCRFEWVRENEPDLLDRSAFLLSPKDFCVATLTGTITTDPLSPVGLVTADGEYNEGVLALMDGFAERQAPISAFDAIAGKSNGRLGLPPDLPVAVGTMDAWGGIFGCGAVHPAMSFEISGTSEVIGTVSAHAGYADGIIAFPPVRGLHMLVGPTQAGGDALRWVAGLLAVSVPEALALADACQDDDPPLLFLPHLAGERAPVWNPDARGVWFGLTSQTGPGQLVRSVLEGVAFSARRVMDRCRESTPEAVEAVRLSGGPTESALWNQIKADVLGLTGEVVTSPSSGALGAALLGAAAHGGHGPLEDLADRLVTLSDRLAPTRSKQTRLNDLFGQYCDLYDHLVRPFEALRSTPT